MDVADGLGSNRPREQILEIMKDSRVGAMGVIAAIMLVLVKAAAVHELSAAPLWLILPPLAARYMLVLFIWFFPYLSGHGMGAGLRHGLSKSKLLCNGLFTLGLAVLLFQWAGFLVLIGAFIAAWLMAGHLCKKLGGLTGDCYGAIVEGTEASALLFILLAGRFG
jgi:adenosylcobinamide-GDP ribazoletransferase